MASTTQGHSDEPAGPGSKLEKRLGGVNGSGGGRKRRREEEEAGVAALEVATLVYLWTNRRHRSITVTHQ